MKRYRGIVAQYWLKAREKAEKEHPDEFEVFGRLSIRRHIERGKPCVQAWVGKQAKPHANYAFPSAERREAYIDGLKRNEKSYQEYKAKLRASKEARIAENKSTFKEGAILYASWGYDQTNIDFYQITERRGAYAWIRPIASKRVSTNGYDSYMVVADKDHFTGKPEKKLIGPYGLSLTSYSSASLWDGRPLNETHYA